MAKKKIENFVIYPCPEHGFRSGFILCSWCRDNRRKAVEKLKLGIR